jgi:hypothetical protein
LKNVFPVAFLALMLLVLAYGLFSQGGSVSVSPRPAQQNNAAMCRDGQTQYCSLGNCSGLSTCIGGAWSGCRWEQVCTPGSTATCLKSSCPYALKVCNECGTGYGPCLAAEPG